MRRPGGSRTRRESDLEVNPVREKKLTNVRAAGADDKVFLAPPRLMTLEDAIGWAAPGGGAAMAVGSPLVRCVRAPPSAMG